MSNITEPFISNRTRVITIICCVIVAIGMFNDVYWLWLPAIVIGWACKMADKREQKSIGDKPVLTNREMFKQAGYSDEPVSKMWLKQNEIGCVVGRSEGKSHLDKLSRL
jgi:hypothetical protein